MGSNHSPQPAVIRMFVDYADTVLWLDGPIDYADTALSVELVAALRAWERDFYASLNGDHEFRTAGLALVHSAEGQRLAQRVAREVGHGFVIDRQGENRPASIRLLRSDHPATNPEAARCFTALCAAAQKQVDELTAMAQKGGLYFSAPRTGEEFPSRAQRKKFGRN
ncbi:hypothetical protein [Paeniglutamicibacter terrestris]|uniref:DUF3800 domain-containing protein n=1 Tax=Paeniglutamicibacter terrestris TaxID=2723403 RepID=A0ABX1G4K9_9MICC|nr:hypothetical protein [Paeniglutamicibacter terrestris]ASN39732.1 hypothetical protein CGQ24_12370 [Arthrobacter sp. 7749]NKG20510.1 hypothetical protein [Paeniglutamicibacter terrestris]